MVNHKNKVIHILLLLTQQKRLMLIVIEQKGKHASSSSTTGGKVAQNVPPINIGDVGIVNKTC